MTILKRITAYFITLTMLVSCIPVFAADIASADPLKGWIYTASGVTAEVVTDGSDGVLGNASMRMLVKEVATVGKGSLRTQTSINVIKNRTYVVKLDAKLENGFGAYLYFGSQKMSLIPSGTKNYGWRHFERSFVATADGSVALGFQIAAEDEKLWVDNVVCYDYNTPKIMQIENGDFESAPPMVVDTKTETESTAEDVDEDIQEDLGDLYAVKATINVDGKDDDWDDTIVKHPLTCFEELVKPSGQRTTGNCRIAFDDTNLYFIVEVNDEIHHTMSTYWQGDSIQFSMGEGENVALRKLSERGVAFHLEENRIYKANDDFTAAVIREGTKTVYECAVPWDASFAGNIPGSLKFNVCVNNNDGEARLSAIGLTPGIVSGKNADLYKYLYIWKPLGNIEYCVGAPINLHLGESGNIYVNLKNSTNELQQVKINSETFELADVIDLKPGEIQTQIMPVTALDHNDTIVEFSIISGEEVVEKNTVINTISTYDEIAYKEFMERLAGYADELQELILRCEKKGMSVDYEVADYSIINKFLTDYIERDVAHRGLVQIREFDKVLTKLYNRSVTALKAYLSGEKQPLPVSKFLTSDKNFRFDGNTIYGMTDTNGVIEERPIFLMGWGCFITPYREMPLLSNLGTSLVATSTYINEFILPIRDGNKDWLIVPSRLTPEGVISTSMKDKASGENSLHFIKRTPAVTGRYTMLRQAVPIKPNTTYVYGFKSKGKGITAGGIWIDFAVNTWGDSTKPTITDSADWTEHEYEVTTRAADKEYYLIINLSDKVDEAYVDDIYVCEKGSDVNILKNGDFDHYQPFRTELEKEMAKDGWYVNWDRMDLFEDTLSKGDQNNINVSIGLGLLPDFILDADPQSKVATQSFLPFTLDNDTVRKIQETYIKLIAPIIKRHKSCHDILLSNESRVFTNHPSGYYRPHWKKYLTDLYGTIDKLNENLGTDFKTFDEIDFPKDFATPLGNDYMNFNDGVLAQYHFELADVIKKYLPDFKVYPKYIAYFNSLSQHERGTDYELIADEMDVLGCDGSPVIGRVGSHTLNMIGFYDMFCSMADKPIWNTEQHIMPDGGNVDNNRLIDDMVDGTMWNGAIHGRNGVANWLWEHDRSTSAFDNTNARSRPGYVSAVSKSSLDLNRLAYEVYAIRNQKPKVGILYSRTSITYNSKCFSTCFSAYTESLFNGQKVRFVLDSKPENVFDCELLIVPDATNIDEHMLSCIKKFVENGGKILIYGEDSLRMNEYQKPHDEQTLKFIYDNADTTSTVTEKIAEMQLSDVMLINTKTGEKPKQNIEWSYTNYNGKTLVNIMSYETDLPVNLKVMYKGKEVTEFTELRSYEKMTDSITIKPYQAVLLEF